MITPKVWFKLINPTDNWTKVSLEEVEDVDDLKKKIKIEMAPKLDTFTSSSLTLKATYNNDNPNEAVELREKDVLVSVLRLFNIEKTNVKDSFAKNILLFVTASSDMPGKRKSTESNEFDKKQKLNPLFESIYNIAKSQKDQLLEMQQDQQKNNVIKHNEELAVIEKKVLYVRKSYKYLYDQLKKKSGYGLKKFLITGTSGIGKSCFLVYVLMQLLCEDVVVIFQPINSQDFYCFKDQIITCGTYNDFEYLLNLTTTWYLADGITSPKLVYGTTVVSLSPNGIAKTEFQEFDKLHPIEYYMGPWTLEELLYCREHAFPLVLKEIVTNLFHKAGGVPRYVLRNVEASIKDVVGNKEETLDAEDKKKIEEKAYSHIELAISKTDNFDKIIKCFTEDEKSRVEISNRIIHRWPDDTHRNYHYKWASPYVFERIQEKLEETAWVDCLHKIRLMRSPYEASAKGFLFECYVIHLFRTGNQKFEVRKLTGEEKDQFFVHHKPEAGFVRNLSDLLKYSGENIVIVPDKQNFGAVDLFVTPNYIFQVTVSEYHPIKQVELTKVITNMPVYISDQNAKIQLYFVVPDDIYDKFKHQSYTTRDKDSNEDRPVLRMNPAIKNVEQWALKVQINLIL
ncbi:hypothetical protein RhiirA5_504506 [Rhizophagus irregularis]|uniref:Crinkler family protein n=1 Tax=Rhizophagus irregularis TaxID=588596 RepID=A0A2N0P474_9GLOM|nr:hypothetical protein RhiirA5_504506 [Rhizophagus irregularis]CAB5193513.1 unnamed protein product [Rhizophagus irregularis]